MCCCRRRGGYHTSVIIVVCGIEVNKSRFNVKCSCSSNYWCADLLPLLPSLQHIVILCFFTCLACSVSYLFFCACCTVSSCCCLHLAFSTVKCLYELVLDIVLPRHVADIMHSCLFLAMFRPGHGHAARRLSLLRQPAHSLKLQPPPRSHHQCYALTV